MPTVISCFDKSGVMVRPWADAGYTCYCVDIQHKRGEHERDGIIFVGADMLTWVPPRSIVNSVAFAAFFPPCDHLSVSGARWFKGKGLGALADSIRLFERSAFWAEWFGAPYLIENPVSTISTYWRKSDYTFDPSQYGDPWTKKTCLWTGGGFVMPPKTPVLALEGSKMHRLPPGPDRKDKRSETPPGFAQAVFEANHKLAEVV